MIEHRLIERMIRLLDSQREAATEQGTVNVGFINSALGFLRTYADRCHHGKEEDILFRDLAQKSLSPEHSEMMEQLLADHARARVIVGQLTEASERYAQNQPAAVVEVAGCLQALCDLYPEHIATEDKRFFLPAMQYFSDEEKTAMLDEMARFDRQFGHDQYRALVAQYEEQMER